jgi:hypothetical protein
VSTSSISRGHTWNPLVLIRSFLRIDEKDVAVLVQVREVAGMKPGRAVGRIRSASAVSSGLFQYSVIDCGARMNQLTDVASGKLTRVVLRSTNQDVDVRQRHADRAELSIALSPD